MTKTVRRTSQHPPRQDSRDVEAPGVGAVAYGDDVRVSLLQIIHEIVAVVPFVKQDLAETSIAVKDAKILILSSPGPLPTDDESNVPAAAELHTAQGEGIIIVGIRVGMDAVVGDYVVNVAKKGGTEAPARLLARVPDKPVAMIIAQRGATLKIGYLEHAVYDRLKRSARFRVDPGRRWMLKYILELPDTLTVFDLFRQGVHTRANASRASSESTGELDHEGKRTRSDIGDGSLV